MTFALCGNVWGAEEDQKPKPNNAQMSDRVRGQQLGESRLRSYVKRSLNKRRLLVEQARQDRKQLLDQRELMRYQIAQQLAQDWQHDFMASEGDSLSQPCRELPLKNQGFLDNILYYSLDLEFLGRQWADWVLRRPSQVAADSLRLQSPYRISQIPGASLSADGVEMTEVQWRNGLNRMMALFQYKLNAFVGLLKDSTNTNEVGQFQRSMPFSSLVDQTPIDTGFQNIRRKRMLDYFLSALPSIDPVKENSLETKISIEAPLALDDDIESEFVSRGVIGAAVSVSLWLLVSRLFLEVGAPYDFSLGITDFAAVMVGVGIGVGRSLEQDYKVQQYYLNHRWDQSVKEAFLRSFVSGIAKSLHEKDSYAAEQWKLFLNQQWDHMKSGQIQALSTFACELALAPVGNAQPESLTHVRVAEPELVSAPASVGDANDKQEDPERPRIRIPVRFYH